MRLFKNLLWWFLVLYVKDKGEASDFHYPTSNEAENWGGMCNTGINQSPINLDPSVALMSHYQKLTLMNYDTDVKTNITNTGHSLQVAFGQQFGMKVTAGGLGGMYTLDQMHFHWGSEHTLAGKRYALELHLVHHEERFSSIGEAAAVHNGLAVLGVLFHLSEDGNPALDVVLDAGEAVKKSPHRASSIDDPINPVHFLPRNTDKFYRYEGSLTTPGCNEAVIWTVFEKSQPISKLQLERFREMRSSDDSALKYNYRPLKPLGDRILIYHDIMNHMSAATVTSMICAKLTIGTAALTLFTSSALL